MREVRSLTSLPTPPGETGVNAGSAPPRAREREVNPAKNTPRDGRRRAGLFALVHDLTPPEPWRHRPHSLAALWRYASRGEWAGPTGPARTAGIWWFRLVTVPGSVLTHYAAWVIARPSRTATVAVIWAVLMHIPLVHTVAGWLLPFDPWPTWLP
ncbi:MAG: hypothetical protein ACRD0P_31740 [Stackebrandtia sp.]